MLVISIACASLRAFHAPHAYISFAHVLTRILDHSSFYRVSSTSAVFVAAKYAREIPFGGGARRRKAREYVVLDDFQFLPRARWLVRSRFSRVRALNFSFRLLERSHIRGFHPPPPNARGPFNCYPCARNREFSSLHLFQRAADTKAGRSKRNWVENADVSFLNIVRLSHLF